jgi:hypothetical protein
VHVDIGGRVIGRQRFVIGIIGIIETTARIGLDVVAGKFPGWVVGFFCQNFIRIR